jgi:hypothetical protein
MATNTAHRFRLNDGLWSQVEAAAAAKAVQPSAIIEDALLSYFGPRQAIEDAARIVESLLIDRTAILSKIDLLFAVLRGSETETIDDDI